MTVAMAVAEKGSDFFLGLFTKGKSLYCRLRAKQLISSSVEPLNLTYDLSRDPTIPNTGTADIVGSRDLRARDLGAEIFRARGEGNSVETDRVLRISSLHTHTFWNCIINPESSVLTHDRRKGAEALRVNGKDTLSSSTVGHLTLRNTSEQAKEQYQLGQHFEFLPSPTKKFQFNFY